MQKKLIGPFKQVLSLADIPLKGAISDQQLHVIPESGIRIEDGKIIEIGTYSALKATATADTALIVPEGDQVAVPSFTDCHTHIAFAGNRANDFALRNAGATYLEIAQAGGGIWSTVQHTRQASETALVKGIIERANFLLAQGITTIEVKSGYGLSIPEELKMLRAIKEAQKELAVTLIPTCLAAHMKPRDFEGDNSAYLRMVADNLFPILKEEGLTTRIDAFIEQSAFSAEEITPYFEKARAYGFDITVHADQFTTSGSAVAVSFGARSADHLEASTEQEVALLAQSDTVAVALPGASVGLGCAFTPARQLLDQGAALAIATDWNPGSAPMGQLMAQASILATAQKLSNAELFAAITFRAAHALNITNRGRLAVGEQADFITYKTDNYQNITYLQGSLQPEQVWKDGTNIFTKGERA